jgi:hypothetical protein
MRWCWRRGDDEPTRYSRCRCRRDGDEVVPAANAGAAHGRGRIDGESKICG